MDCEIGAGQERPSKNTYSQYKMPPQEPPRNITRTTYQYMCPFVKLSWIFGCFGVARGSSWGCRPRTIQRHPEGQNKQIAQIIIERRGNHLFTRHPFDEQGPVSDRLWAGLGPKPHVTGPKLGPKVPGPKARAGLKSIRIRFRAHTGPKPVQNRPLLSSCLAAELCQYEDGVN